MPHTLLILQTSTQTLSDSAACATRKRPKLTACRCKWLGSWFSMLSLHPGSLLQLQTGIDCGGQRLWLSLRDFGRKVCDVYSSHNRFSWYSQPASSLYCVVTCTGVSLALGALSDLFSTAVFFTSIGRVAQPFTPLPWALPSTVWSLPNQGRQLSCCYSWSCNK